jgi:hypothetical protein
VAEDKIFMEIIKVAFGIPNEGHTEPEAYDNRMVMSHHLGILQVLSAFNEKEFDGIKFDYPDNVKFEFYIVSIGKVFTALARERIAEYAVESGMDYLFMIDDDMITESDIFERLFKHNVDICAGLAFTRTSPHKPVIYEVNKGYDELVKKDYYINSTIVKYPKDTLVECDAVGFGAVLIKVKVLRGMKKPWFMSTSGAGEDIHFCHTAREQGFKVFMDTATKMGHLGYPPIITEEDYNAQNNIKELEKIYGEKSTCPARGNI